MFTIVIEILICIVVAQLFELFLLSYPSCTTISRGATALKLNQHSVKIGAASGNEPSDNQLTWSSALPVKVQTYNPHPHFKMAMTDCCWHNSVPCILKIPKQELCSPGKHEGNGKNKTTSIC